MIITPQPAHDNAEAQLKWLCESERNMLDEHGLNPIVRLLIAKVNEQAAEIDAIKKDLEYCITRG